MQPLAPIKFGSLLLLLAAAGCMQAEYPDEFEDQVQTTTLGDAAIVVAPDAQQPTLPADAGLGTAPVLPDLPEASVAAPEAGGAIPPRDASTPVNPVRDASALPEAAVASDAASTSDSAPPSTGPELSSCTITASTDASDTFLYAGKYGCAVWIANASNKVVKAFFVATRIASRSGLPTYKSQSSGVTVDIVAGATLGSAKQHQYTWDLEDTAGAKVPPGKYTLQVETHSSGGVNLASIPFDLSKGPVSEKGSKGQVRSASITCN